jgi:hypothetical protein
MITPEERRWLEERAAREPTIEAMALLLHARTGHWLWLCRGWARWIARSRGLERNGNER